MKWPCEIVRVTNPLQRILQPRRDWLIARRLKALIDREKVLLFPALVHRTSKTDFLRPLCGSQGPCPQTLSTKPVTHRTEEEHPILGCAQDPTRTSVLFLIISCPCLRFERKQRKDSVLPAEGKGTRYGTKL